VNISDKVYQPRMKNTKNSPKEQASAHAPKVKTKATVIRASVRFLSYLHRFGIFFSHCPGASRLGIARSHPVLPEQYPATPVPVAFV
jgi:hypothetical protein